MDTQASERQRMTRTYRVVQVLDKWTSNLSLWLNWIAGGGLVLMLLLVIGDIIGIKIFSAPIPGAIEIVAFLGVVVIGFAVAYTQVLHGHIRVDFIVLKFPPRLASIIDILMLILGMTFFILLSWRSFDYGYILQSSGEVSMTQRLPFYPFVYGMAVCFLVTFLVLLVEFIKSIIKAGKVWSR
jgi:TRAP-type C4-dicarboxylate transport system permease small subunit